MRNTRVLLTKIGFDGHDRGVKLVASAMRDAGLEVIYTGPWQTVEGVAETALQEDVDVIGISSLGYDHVLIPQLMELLRKKNLNDVLVIVGGVIPPDEVTALKDAGVAEVFPPGTKLNSIVEYVEGRAEKR
ncbi:MAG: cobalamin B12-binding domain-containing protein [Thermodesulfobacteriota bacterium]|nr:cobalamin B12-binding domain-containing protein [Thermodesulfobacteriota bacterium]